MQRNSYYYLPILIRYLDIIPMPIVIVFFILVNLYKGKIFKNLLIIQFINLKKKHLFLNIGHLLYLGHFQIFSICVRI